MMNVIAILLTVCSIATAQYSRSEGGGDVKGSGGAGLHRNGRNPTFGTAHFIVKEKSISEIPGMRLMEKLFGDSTLDGMYKGRLIGAVIPSTDRKYFDISAEDLSPRQKEELIERYKEQLDIKDSTIPIYAVTNIQTRETYILPDFYTLVEEEEKAAILFHESCWLIDSTLSYRRVVDFESEFQYYLERKKGESFTYDREFFSLMGLLFKNAQIPIFEAIKEDFRMGRFHQALFPPPAPSNRKRHRNVPSAKELSGIPVSFVFGHLEDLGDVSSKVATPILKAHAYEMNEKYPQMEVFHALLTQMSKVKVPTWGSNEPREAYFSLDQLDASRELWISHSNREYKFMFNDQEMERR